MMSSARDAVFRCEQLHGALGDGQLALAREGLRLQLVFVDGAHHQRRAVGPGERADPLELLFAVFQVDRVDDALALAVGQRQFDGPRIGGVDHDRRFDLADQLRRRRAGCPSISSRSRGLQADVDDVRAVAHLAPRDLAGLFPLLFRDQVLEQARADDVGALADDQRAVALFGFDQLDAGIVGAVRRRRDLRGASALDHRSRWRVMCAGVVPQQPPTMLSQPWSTNCSNCAPASRASPGTCLLRWAARRSDSRRCAWSPSRAACGCGRS